MGVQHDPMLRVAQQPSEHRGVMRKHERGLARTDRVGDRLVEPRNGRARESNPSTGEVHHARALCGAPCTGVLDDGSAGVSRCHRSPVEDHEVLERRAVTRSCGSKTVDHGRDRGAGARREVVAGGDGMENVDQEFHAVFRIRASSATGALRRR